MDSDEMTVADVGDYLERLRERPAVNAGAIQHIEDLLKTMRDAGCARTSRQYIASLQPKGDDRYEELIEGMANAAKRS